MVSKSPEPMAAGAVNRSAPRLKGIRMSDQTAEKMTGRKTSKSVNRRVKNAISVAITRQMANALQEAITPAFQLAPTHTAMPSARETGTETTTRSRLFHMEQSPGATTGWLACRCSRLSRLLLFIMRLREKSWANRLHLSPAAQQVVVDAGELHSDGITRHLLG